MKEMSMNANTLDKDREITGLKKLALAVDAAMSQELGEPLDDILLREAGIRIAPRRTRVVAGSTIISNAGRDEDTDPHAAQTVDAIYRFRADRTCVMNKLRRGGSAPDTIITINALHHLCTHYDLYDLCPRDGLVCLDAGIILQTADKKARDEASCVAWSNAWRTFFIVTGLVIATVLLGRFMHPLWFLASFMIGCLGYLAILPTAADGHPDTATKHKYIREGVVEHESAGDLDVHLWPGRQEPGKGTGILVDLPAPPTDLHDHLVAMERTRLPVHVVLASHMIMFKQSVADALCGIKKNVETSEKPFVAANRAPFAYIREGNAVAIICYDDFIIDDAVIDTITNENPLI